MFDLFIYPFGYQKNNEYSHLTGFFVGNILRKANRNRVEDLIIFRFTPFRVISSAEEIFINSLVSDTCEKYYRSKGPITTTAKRSVEFFNEKLVSLNSKNSFSNNLTGSIHFLIFHREDLYVLQAGGATTFLITSKNMEKFEERSIRTEGIGIGRSINPRFYHAKMNLNDRLILSSKYPESWTKEKLFDENNLSISHLRRTLINESKREFEAIIVQLREGSGNVHQLKLDSSEDLPSDEGNKKNSSVDQVDIEKENMAELENVEPSQVLEKEQSEKRAEKVKNDSPMIFDIPPFSQTVSEQEVTQPPLPDDDFSEQEKYWEEVTPNSDEIPSTQDSELFKVQPTETESPSVEEAYDFASSEKIPSAEESEQGLYLSGDTINIEKESEVEIIRKPKVKKNTTFTVFLLKSRSFFYKLNAQIKNFKSKLQSFFIKGIKSTSIDKDIQDNQLSSTSMLMIAILVAVFVSAIGISVYFQSGLGSQQRELIANANLLVADALEEADGNHKILLYEEALRLVTESETYGKSKETSEFKDFIQKELDDLKGINRLDVQYTILGGLDRRINIKKMEIHESGDIYALDTDTGRVIRLVSTSSDFAVDTAFVCGPGKYGDVIVDGLIDIEAINYANKLNATLMGIDSRGNLILCSKTSEPVGIKLRQSEVNWGEIKALTFNGYYLFILDSGEVTRDIYRYPANDYEFDLIPESIFSTNIPEYLIGAVDIAANQEELFLIDKESELTRCNLYGGNTGSACENNIGYGVIVDGQSRETISTISGTDFSQIYLTDPPDPSIYFLDNASGSIYHFSLALNLQQLIRPNLNSVTNAPDDTPLTAFAVNPNGVIHFAYANQIYYGFLP